MTATCINTNQAHERVLTARGAIGGHFWFWGCFGCGPPLRAGEFSLVVTSLNSLG